LLRRTLMNIHRRRRAQIGRPRRQRVDDTLWTLVLTLIAGALLTLTTAMSAFSELEQLGPSIGNIIVFRPLPNVTEWWHIEAKLADHPGRTCILSPAVMAMTGGSLIIEARKLSSPPVYRVHWAGKHTGLGTADCGVSADLILSRSELMRLADVSGGFNSNLRMVGP
jgi:hypothetical protein